MNFFRFRFFSLIMIISIIWILSPAVSAQTDTPESAAGVTPAVPEPVPVPTDSSDSDEVKTESAAEAVSGESESAPAPPKTLSVQVRKANVRDDASLSAKINAQLKKGQAVTVLEVKDDWYHIQLEDGEDGWAHESLFSGEKNEKAVRAGDSISIQVSAGNIRQSPELGADVLTVLKKGEHVNVLESGEDWYRVRIPDGTEGWVHRKLFVKAPPKKYPLGGIRIERAAKDEEKVYFIYKGPEPPTVFITHAGSPRIVCDFSDTRPDRTIQQKTEVNGTLIQAVRLGLHGEDQRDARIVFDMASDLKYELEHFFVKGELYVLIIRKSA